MTIHVIDNLFLVILNFSLIRSYAILGDKEIKLKSESLIRVEKNDLLTTAKIGRTEFSFFLKREVYN
jgi:hypothetical protein